MAYDKAYYEAYYKANKEKIITKNKAYSLKYKYNITLKERDLMLKKQNNKCKICLVTFSETDHNYKTNIDHCHTTNKVRGILCGLCNKGLGQFKDNTKTLTQAINYLQENG